MSTPHLPDPLKTLRELSLPGGKKGHYYSLEALRESLVPGLNRLPVSIRIVLESVLRHCGGGKVHTQHVEELAHWSASTPLDKEIPFSVARVLLQDFTGVPLLVDLAAMREAAHAWGYKPEAIEPLVPVNLVVDHSVQVDVAGTPEAFQANLDFEFKRNRERYEFLKWGQEAFKTFTVVPPSVGIVHQVNLEYLASVVFQKDLGEGAVLLYPDTLVGTDSHTTMVNGLGVVGWGVGGIEAEVAMLGEPVYFQTPSVIGVHLEGRLQPGVTATDLTLRLTELLRAAKVVGQFVEFFGEGAASLSVADRSTIANMAPEYGATMGFFPSDEKTLDYLRLTGRSDTQLKTIEAYLKAQGLFGMPKKGDIDYSRILELDLGSIKPCVAGPKRPQDRIDLENLKTQFNRLFTQEVAQGGYGKPESERTHSVTLPADGPFKAAHLNHGSVLIAAITSCTNTSNPDVMVAAGLLAKKAVELGLRVPAYVKASLAPGSRVVTDYLNLAELTPYLDKLGFTLAGYGCTTCIGNSGPLNEQIENAIQERDLVCASVLSGNRNFEARIHPNIRANFLMSPPLVVAFALAGRVDIDLYKEPLGLGKEGKPVYLKDIWPSDETIAKTVASCLQPELFRKKYAQVYTGSDNWENIPQAASPRFAWKETSTYIQHPPFFEGLEKEPAPLKPLKDMRVLAILGDSVTTDHISPAGFIAAQSPAGRYLTDHGVDVHDFNSYGSRRGNDRVMTRGTFANGRIKNALAQGKEGGFTTYEPSGELLPIFDACERYKAEGTPLIVFAGKDYGMGSSRDWAAKGTALLGVRAVVAVSFERIHRSNLIGMGVLPLEFRDGDTPADLELNGKEIFTIEHFTCKPQEVVHLVITREDGSTEKIPLTSRLDNTIEVAYYQNGGLLPYVLRLLLKDRV